MDPSEIPHGIFCLMKSPTSHSLKYDEKKAGTRCFRMFQTKPRLKKAFSANSVSQLSFYVFLLFPSMAQQEFYSSSCSISDSFFFPGAKRIPSGASSLQNPITKYLGKLMVYPYKYLEQMSLCHFPSANSHSQLLHLGSALKILFKCSLKQILLHNFLNNENL